MIHSFQSLLLVKTGPLCKHAMQSCITFAILSSMVFFGHPNLLHAVICVWLPWFMFMCIHLSVFTVRLGVALLLSRKKSIFLLFMALTFLCVSGSSPGPYSSYISVMDTHAWDYACNNGYSFCTYFNYSIETSIWYPQPFMNIFHRVPVFCASLIYR